MTYYYAKTFARPFDEVVAATRQALGEEGFGVITEIDMRQTLKAKIGEDFRPYKILGACNPRMAFEALQLEDKVGIMLPCNVIVQDAGGGRTEVAAVDPVASMASIANPALMEKASIIGASLRAAIDRIHD
jgi:uncharacterized protein (DUF302 family)